jgi:LPXTG-motif cell wall-anchored protein
VYSHPGITASAVSSTSGTVLAYTGAEHVVGLVILGFGMLSAGVTLITLARRRRHSVPTP